jgi:hypothetical protein
VNSGKIVINSGKSRRISGKIALIPEFYPTIPENSSKAWSKLCPARMNQRRFLFYSTSDKQYSTRSCNKENLRL